MKNTMDETNSKLDIVEIKTCKLDLPIETNPNEMQRKNRLKNMHGVSVRCGITLRGLINV